MNHLKRFFRLLLCCLIFSYYAASTAAQVATNQSLLEKSKQQLTGGSARDWVFQVVHTIMGAQPRCSQGEVYRFSADSTLLIERCVNGSMQTTSHRWIVSLESPYDVQLQIDGKPYHLLFKQEPNADLMVLREPSPSKIAPTVDRQFRLSRD